MLRQVPNTINLVIVFVLLISIYQYTNISILVQQMQCHSTLIRVGPISAVMDSRYDLEGAFSMIVL